MFKALIEGIVFAVCLCAVIALVVKFAPETRQKPKMTSYSFTPGVRQVVGTDGKLWNVMPTLKERGYK